MRLSLLRRATRGAVSAERLFFEFKAPFLMLTRATGRARPDVAAPPFVRLTRPGT